jgi:hypothetical protein
VLTELPVPTVDIKMLLKLFQLDLEGHPPETVILSSWLADTKLDGSYLITYVEPGKYHILAEMPGYLSPLAPSTPETVELPSAEDKKVAYVMQQL